MKNKNASLSILREKCDLFLEKSENFLTCDAEPRSGSPHEDTCRYRYKMLSHLISKQAQPIIRICQGKALT